MKRAVITGLGIISSIGNNKKEVINSLKKGKSGISFSEKFKNYGIRSHICGDINIKNKYFINCKEKKFMNKESIYAYIAMKQAIKDSKLTQNLISNKNTGLIVGTAVNSFNNRLSYIKNETNKKKNRTSPFMIIKSMNSNISACLAVSFKIKGINYSINSACTTSSHCIGNAYEMIKFNKQKIIFAGGAEELCCELARKFDAINALSIKYNKTPKKSPRAYDKNRDGFVISGGGGIIVVEELEHAISRFANIYAEIIGYGTTSDGFNMFSPNIDGAFRCMKIALKNVKKPIDYINTHGTSTLIGDIKELIAIKKVFGKNYNPALSSTKSMTGHSLGASGVHEIIYTLLMMKHNFIAPSINIDNMDKITKNSNIVTNMIKKKLYTTMSNNFGFGGTNTTIVMQNNNINNNVNKNINKIT